MVSLIMFKIPFIWAQISTAKFYKQAAKQTLLAVGRSTLSKRKREVKLGPIVQGEQDTKQQAGVCRMEITTDGSYSRNQADT